LGDAALSSISFVGGLVQEIKNNLFSSSTGNVTHSTDALQKIGFEAKSDFSNVLDWNGSNEPTPANMPNLGISFINDNKIVNETTVSGNIQGVPTELNFTNEQSANGGNTNSVNFKVGTNNANVYLQGSNTAKSDGTTESNVAAGGEIATPPIKIDENKTITFKAYGEIQINAGGK
jgi:hypothetical protein